MSLAGLSPKADRLPRRKRLLNSAPHSAVSGDGIVQRMAEAVTFAPALDVVFDNPVMETDFGWPVHKDARAIPKRQCVTLPVSRPTARTEERTNCNTLGNKFCGQSLAFAEKLKGPEGSLQRGILFATPLSLACWLALFAAF